MSKNDEQVNFRMPSLLRKKLKESSDYNNRTLTAEIVARLEASFEPHISTADTGKVTQLIALALNDLHEQGFIQLTEKTQKLAK